MPNPYYWDRGPADHLMEECAEVIQEICKAHRFGWHNWHPEDAEQTPNYLRVFKEVKDLEKRIAEFKKWW